MSRVGRAASVLFLAGLLGGLGFASQVRANGNYSHLWAAKDALAQLEAGDLRDLLSRPELQQMLQNGANFPDGGYAVGDDYGELAHWEPFHLVYLDWIKANYTQPWSDEAAQHIAFLMGMAAHGTSDQLYDGMFLERHEYYDQGGGDVPILGLDGATDACFASMQGPIEVPATWVPADVMATLVEVASGHVVEAKTITTGQKLVSIAIMASNDAVNSPEKVASYMEVYPYACGQQNNMEIPGTIPRHGAVIVQYWAVLWARLNGDEIYDMPLTGTFYTGQAPFEQELDASKPDSWVSFTMPFGLEPSTVNQDTVIVTADDGSVHPVYVDVYYGNNSHLVNIMPSQNWREDTDYTVTILPPIASWDDHPTTVERTFQFSTKTKPVDPGGDTVDGDDLGATVDGNEESDLRAEETFSDGQTDGAMGDASPNDLAAPDAAGDVADVSGEGQGSKDKGCSGSPAGGQQATPWLWGLLAGLAALRLGRKGGGGSEA